MKKDVKARKKMRIYDLSVTIYPGMLKWVTDPGVSLTQISSIVEGDAYNFSQLTCSSHIGTHIDAPAHFTVDGRTVDKLSLYDLIGEALVVQISSDTITAEDLRDIDFERYKRILFKTTNSELLKTAEFNKEYASLDYSAAALLVKNGVRVVGIDYLSIEEFDTEEHPVHKILTGNDVLIIESLDLREVEPGAYLLVALPLKLRNCDGSPARVVLIEV